MNKERKVENLRLRAQVVQAVRNFFIQKDYLEVETPVRIPAPAPEANIDAVSSNGWFLQTSPELCMKRLISAGHPRIFQVCRCFRQGERGDRHLPEFSMLEWYCANSNYLEQMDLCEALIEFVSNSIFHKQTIVYQGETIDLKRPWKRTAVHAAFESYASLSMEEALLHDRFDEVMACEIEHRLGHDRPLFLFDYPASLASLAKLKPDNPLLSERFELYIAGLELCNTFSELIDPDEQKERFVEEREHRREQGKVIYPMPESFLTSLKNMPETAGCALGIDRLVMLFCDAKTIDDVVTFTPEAL